MDTNEYARNRPKQFAVPAGLKKVLQRLTIPLPLRVLFLLGTGLLLGLFFPTNSLVKAAYVCGTYFPRLIVSLAALLVFHLLAAATAKLVLYHEERAGTLFAHIVLLYVVMGIVSLLYAFGWVAILTDIPVFLPGESIPTPMGWMKQFAGIFSHVLFQQPLIQVLGGGVLTGWLTARVTALNRVAYGLISAGDRILAAFRKLLWYYPIMIGCLAIAIPLKFGHRGLALYGQCILWIMIVTVVWCLAMMAVCKVATKRTWKQILSYYGTVWPTGFGTGGSYDTLAVNLISAEKDLGLSPEIAEVSIVFGTVLNKNCGTMCVLIVTVIVSKLLSLPLSLVQLALIIPPVLILGLESPGIPGGTAYFMAPVVAVLLNVQDPTVWTATFIAVYTGLIPMFGAAGNTTDDGLVGALIEDRFHHAVTHTKSEAAHQRRSTVEREQNDRFGEEVS